MTVLLVAASGGHLTQLVELCPRLGLGDDVLWVTQPGPQSDSVLRGCRRIDAPRVDERDVRGVARAAALAHRVLRQHDVDAVISTGSGIALGFLPLARARRLPATYIESATWAKGPSLTGRVLQRVPGLHLHTQHPSWADGRWTYAGSVFEGFERRPRPDGAALRRVVVTLGSERWPFRSLVDRLLEVLPGDAEVTWQTGRTPVHDLRIPAVPYLPAHELESAIAGADVVVAHAGCGSALTALSSGRVPVLVPRDPARGEFKDRHQWGFAAALAERGLAVVRPVDALTLGDLEAAARSTVLRRGAPPPMEIAVGGSGGLRRP